ncbi:BatD family protein [Candidatus Protochlamydia sp. W-9]|uniref:BatD family protein n=1 Tax=Candidatus Protochlamydia sp. W-9 TaxID=1785087 RepID=UPI00096A6E8E|nr:BatD family protein [Candidatus Protochlamydia sp. W-9]
MIRALCIYFLSFMSTLSAVNIKVEASIDSQNNQENHPLSGIISITHQIQDEIDSNSFQIEGKPLSVTFIKNVNVSGELPKTIVSFYHFTLSPQAKGLYVLPPISVKIRDKIQSSPPSSYEVKGLKSSLLNPKNSKFSPASIQLKRSSPSNALIFKLEASIKGPTLLYPGQRTNLFYRISYNQSVDLTESLLPFIHADAFKKIGDAHIRDFQNGEITVQEISQEVEANQIGSFKLGPSSISGYSYQTNFFGKKNYQQPLLKAEAPAVYLQVKPFPLENKPYSFNGALGVVDVKIKMRTSSERQLEDKILIDMYISGVENLEDFQLPDFYCQPGFSGFFQFNDLPLTGEIKESSKYFQIELIPVSTFINTIPSFEISSFDPVTSRYILKRTDPIPIDLKTMPMAPYPTISLEKENEIPNEKILWNSSSWPLSPLEIKDSQNLPRLGHNWTQTPWILLVIPLGISWLTLQSYWKKLWDLKPKKIKKQSLILLEQALKTKKSSEKEILQLLEKATWWKVWEEGILPIKVTSLEDLSTQGKAGKMRQFIYQLQSLQYGPSIGMKIADIKVQAQKLLS